MITSHRQAGRVMVGRTGLSGPSGTGLFSPPSRARMKPVMGILETLLVDVGIDLGC